MDYEGSLMVGCVGQLMINKTKVEMEMVTEQFCMYVCSVCTRLVGDGHAVEVLHGQF